MLTTVSFNITEVTGIYRAGSGLSPRPPQWVGVESMDVECLACGYAWSALPHGVGHFDGTVNGVTIITCPDCSTEEPVSNRALQQECEN